MKFKKFLLTTYKLAQNDTSTIIRSDDFKRHLNLAYKEEIKQSNYWLKQGAIKQHPMRGGEFEYRITDHGLFLGEKLKNSRKKRLINIGIILIIICFTVLYLNK